MIDNLTEQHRRKRSDLSEAIDRVPGLRDRLSYDRRRRAERKGDAMRASLSAHLEESARRTVDDAAEHGETMEARRLGVSRKELAILRDATGMRPRAQATDALETPLQRAVREALESCRLA